MTTFWKLHGRSIRIGNLVGLWRRQMRMKTRSVGAWMMNRCPRPAAVALVMLLAGATPLSATAQAPDDRLAIDFQATRLDGTLFNGSTFEGHVVLLDFWAVWCRPCIEAFPKLNHLARELAELDVEIIGIAAHSGSPDEVADFLEGHDIQFPVVVAGEELVYRLGVIGYPTYLLVGPDGTIAKRYVGALPNLTDRIMRDVMMLQQARSAP